MDCVISVGAISRSDRPVETINEAFRMLRPGGLFVFVEPDNSGDMAEQILKIFPEKIVGASSAGEKAVYLLVHIYAMNAY